MFLKSHFFGNALEGDNCAQIEPVAVECLNFLIDLAHFFVESLDLATHILDVSDSLLASTHPIKMHLQRC